MNVIGRRDARKKRTRTKIVQATLVSEFPEIVRRAHQCRLCMLVETAPDFLRGIHALYREGVSPRTLEIETASEWALRKEAPLARHSFATHFESHVDFDDVSVAVSEAIAKEFVSPQTLPVRVRAQVPALLPPPAKVVVPEVAKVPALVAIEPRVEDLEAAAYFDMQSLIDKLRERLGEADKNTAFLDRDGKVNTYGMILWLKLVDTFRQALEAMNRIRNNDRLTKAILQAHTKRNTQLASAPIVARFEVMLTALRPMLPAGVYAEVEKFATTEVKEMLIEAGKTAIQESCDVYRLH